MKKLKNMIPLSDPRVAQIGHPAPPWLVNYADLMTEMVCFFIILYALSAALSKDVQKAKKDVEEQMKQEKVATEVKVTKDGMQITLEENGENVFFESGSADLSPRMVEILGKITPTLRKLAIDGHDIVVEGHTDDIPIRNAHFASNWELSTARATSVVQHMIQSLRMPPAHMAAIGYGEFHPLVPNDTDEHRAKNRRVVFLVKNKSGNFDKEKKKKEETEPAAEPSSPEVAPAEAAQEPSVQQASNEPSAQPASNEPSAAAEIQTPAEPAAEQAAQ
jgi:chemotaxis protein MotB